MTWDFISKFGRCGRNKDFITLSASGPEMRMMAIPPGPGGVDMAAMVLFWDMARRLGSLTISEGFRFIGVYSDRSMGSSLLAMVSNLRLLCCRNILGETNGIAGFHKAIYEQPIDYTEFF
jgi:hypothetical protein